jgi:septum formation protein
MKQIILASTSPRRHDLLRQIGLKFKIVPSKYKEDMTLKLPPHKLAMFLARGKAQEVAERRKSGIVIGVDTFVVLNKEVIGKPHNKTNAKKILEKISNKTLKVYSGVAIIDAKTKKEIIDYEISKVKIRKISPLEIRKYIATEEPLDKAGAFGMQGLGAIFVAKIDGCYSNVVGLPLHNLTKNLTRMGIDVFSYRN